jgi:hypothetical protein
MTTAQDLVNECRRHIDAGRQDEHNVLSATITSGATTFIPTYALGGIQKNKIVAMELELMLVINVDATTSTVTVVRGYLGSTAASHASGTLITVSPVVSDYQIFQALNEDLDDLSSPLNGLFKISTVGPFTYNISTRGYDLAADVIDIVDVRYHGLGSPLKRYPKLTRYEIVRGQSATDFPSGVGMIIYSYAAPGQPIVVRYKAPFTHFSSLTDDASSVAGLGASMMDIPPLGAAIRLIETTEIKRNRTEFQGEPRRASEVPPGAIRQSTAGLEKRRQVRIQAEAARLFQQFPTSLRV